jgi:hypothetical protein
MNCTDPSARYTLQVPALPAGGEEEEEEGSPTDGSYSIELEVTLHDT